MDSIFYFMLLPSVMFPSMVGYSGKTLVKHVGTVIDLFLTWDLPYHNWILGDYTFLKGNESIIFDMKGTC